MEIILKEDIENLGLAYDVVNVKPGYARNFLIPAGKATLALPSEKAKLEAYLAEIEKAEAAQIESAKILMEELKKTSVKITAKAGTGDKLFGSINSANLVEELEKLGVTIDRKYIKIPGNSIKRAGKYTAKVRLHRLVEHDYEFEIIGDVEKVAKLKSETFKKAEPTGESFANEPNPFATAPKIVAEAPSAVQTSEE